MKSSCSDSRDVQEDLAKERTLTMQPAQAKAERDQCKVRSVPYSLQMYGDVAVMVFPVSGTGFDTNSARHFRRAGKDCNADSGAGL